ncbi:hypothetical protein [Paenibacillus taichungensis]|uniref:hypothetical protein n=1 Tax=Paenibacillus taichungensis TaxID=484184 RepID=UPI0035E0F806
MSRRSIGLGLIIASSLFIGLNLISNSILMSGTDEYQMLQIISTEFTSKIGIVLGLILFVLGLAYLIIAEVFKNSKREDHD